MSRYIFLDTNNWIYLSNGFNIYSSKHDELHLKVFEIIKRRVADGSLVFLVNDIILSEWERNKDQVGKQIKEIDKKYKSYVGSLKPITDFINSSAKIVEIELLKCKMLTSYNEKIERHKQHIVRVEEFLKNETIKIEVSDKNKIDSANLALEKKAPFIGDKKNSMADALLLFSSLDYIYNNQKIEFPASAFLKNTESCFAESYFVSSNSGDFSSPDEKEKIHLDLEPFLNRTDTKFYYTLGKLINSLENEFLTEEEENIIEYVDEKAYCDVCNRDYYPTVEFSEYFQIFNPALVKIDRNQLSLEFAEMESSNAAEDIYPYVNIRTAQCDYCSAEFLECTCGELNHIEDYDANFECIGGCGNIFRANADIDRKGMMLGIDYEMFVVYRCETCGCDFDEVDENDLCVECAEYERVRIES